jgi:hypothetical protein
VPRVTEFVLESRGFRPRAWKASDFFEALKRDRGYGDIPRPRPLAAQRRHLRTQRDHNGRRRSRRRAVSHIYTASLRLIHNKDEIPSSL